LGLTVKDVMVNGVVTVEETLNIRNAAILMQRRGVSSLLVIHKGELRGIVTEKDLVTRVLCKGGDPESVKICDVMSQPVMVTTSQTPLEEAIQIMLTQSIKKLPVIDNEKLIGMLSLTDIVMTYPAVYSTMQQLQEIELYKKEPTPYIS
jgi:signal-transduction protein with cAMP-binding, CBS, and nucleotidyltransferase domain